MTQPPHLKSMLATGQGLTVPGIYDAMTALLAEQAGFDCLYLSGASVAYTRLGRPDIGLVSVSELADTVRLITDRVGLPLIVDGDTGFGNAANVQRTVRQIEGAGAAAIQIEDQGFPKRCGHLDGKTLIPIGEMAGKIRAACDARASDDFLIVARTDAIAVEGFEAALDRNGESFTRELEGLLAICLQHEIDHLDGKLFVDYISPLKRQRIRKKLEKDQRRRA